MCRALTVSRWGVDDPFDESGLAVALRAAVEAWAKANPVEALRLAREDDAYLAVRLTLQGNSMNALLAAPVDADGRISETAVDGRNIWVGPRVARCAPLADCAPVQLTNNEDDPICGCYLGITEHDRAYLAQGYAEELVSRGAALTDRALQKLLPFLRDGRLGTIVIDVT